MNDETRELLEEKLIAMLNSLANLKPGSDEHQKLSSDIKVLASTLTEASASEMDAFDKQEKRRIDEQKNKKLEEIEVQKINTGLIKMAVEAVLGVCLTVYEWRKHRQELNIIGKFEETGRWVSTAFRNIKKPRLKK